MMITTLDKIVGQPRAVDLLSRSLENENISHAYLFTGPPGVGKMTTALAFARAIIAKGDRDSDLFFQEGLHPDLLVIEVPEGNSFILKEQISKELIPWIGVKPYRAKHRVVIIRDSQLMRKESANALLKTLEEPPSYGVIILCADVDTITETIISRCQIVRFYTLAQEIISSVLVSAGVEEDKAYRAALLSQGNLELAEKFSRQENEEQLWELAGQSITSLAGPDRLAIFDTADRIKENLEFMAGMMETILRDVMVYKQTGQSNLLIIPQNSTLADSLPPLDYERARQALERIRVLKEYIRYYLNKSLISIHIAREIYQVWQ